MENGDNGKYWCIDDNCHFYSSAEPDGGWESPLEVPKDYWSSIYPLDKDIVIECVQGNTFLIFLDWGQRLCNNKEPRDPFLEIVT